MYVFVTYLPKEHKGVWPSILVCGYISPGYMSPHLKTKQEKISPALSYKYENQAILFFPNSD